MISDYAVGAGVTLLSYSNFQGIIVAITRSLTLSRTLKSPT